MFVFGVALTAMSTMAHALVLRLCVSSYSPLGKYRIQLHDENSDRWLPSSPGIGMHVEVWCVCACVHVCVCACVHVCVCECV